MLSRVISFCLSLLLSCTLSNAQSNNQIAFVAFNADGGDDFAFVALTSIAANANIYFSDNEILNDSSISTGEGILAWSSSNLTSAGTVVIINNAGSSLNINANIGSAQSISGNFNLSASGDAIVAYEGTSENKITNWLSVIENSLNKAGNISSTDLVQNQSYIQFNTTSSPDGGYYQGPRNGELNYNAYKLHILDVNNWHEEVSNGLAILPIGPTFFTIQSPSLTKLVVTSPSASPDTLAKQGDTAYQIADFKLKAIHGGTTVGGLTCIFNSNLTSSDIIQFTLRNSSGNLNSGTLIKSLRGDRLLNDSLLFENISIPIASGDSLVLSLLANLDTNANVSHSFQIIKVDFDLSIGQQVDSVQVFSRHYVTELLPEIFFNPYNYGFRSDSLLQDSINHAIHAFHMQCRFKPSSLLSIDAKIQSSSGLGANTFFKLWYSLDTIFNPQEDQLLAASNYTDSNSRIDFININYHLTKNSYSNFFITVDLSCAASVGSTFRISNLDSSLFKFDRNVLKSGSAGVGSNILITELPRQEVAGLHYQFQGSDLRIDWVNPNCFDETIVFINDQAFNDSLQGQYSVNSNSILDSLNHSLVSGAIAVYLGKGDSVLVSGLSIGKNYFGSVFTRKGSKWSRGHAFNFRLANDPSLIISQYYEGQSNDKWIEISNVGDTAIQLSDFYLARWSNTSNPIGSASSSNRLSGVLTSGSTILMQHSSASKPSYAAGSSGGSLAFNGNDVIAVCRESAKWYNRIDCIYGSGTWGANTSFYRKAEVLKPNRNQSVLDGKGEWWQIAISKVDTISLGNSSRLGEHEWGLGSGDFTFDGSIWLPQEPKGLSTLQTSIVIQKGYAIIDSNLQCSFFKVLDQAILEITNAATLSIADSLVNDGQILVNSDASIVQNDSASVNPNSGKGSFSIKKVYQATAVDRFKFWSAPLSNARIENSFRNSNPLDLYYVQSGGQNSGYKSYPTGKMEAGRAYAVTPGLLNNLYQVNFNDTIFFTGDSLNNGEISINMDSLNPGDYVFLGNPYPSAMDYNLFLDENPGLISSIWYWDASPDDKANSAFAVWNSQGAVSIGNSKRASPSNIIPALQGFIVKLGHNISPNTHYNFAFKNNMRLGSSFNASPFFKSKLNSIKIKLALRSDKAESYCLISSNPQATDQFDEAYDAPIYKANQNQSFYSMAAHKHLSIQSLSLKPEVEQIVALGIDAWHKGGYTIILDTSSVLDSSLSITLIDSLNLFERDLRSQAYSFQIASPGKDTSRFYLKIGRSSSLSFSSKGRGTSQIEVFQNAAGEIELNLAEWSNIYSKAQLLNLSSQQLEEWTLEPGRTHITLPLKRSLKGIYVLNLFAEEEIAYSCKIHLYK